MKLTFNIDYRTNWGESVYLKGCFSDSDSIGKEETLKMNFDGHNRWSYSLSINESISEFTYRYVVKDGTGNVKEEWGSPKQLKMVKGITDYIIVDNWQDRPSDKPFYSSAFIDGIFSRDRSKKQTQLKGGDLLIKIFAPIIDRDEVLAISGDNKELGEWDVSKAILMNDSNFPEWSASINLANTTKPFEYKFVILNKKTKDVVAWEGCNNRYYSAYPIKGSSIQIMQGLTFVNPKPNWKGAGTAIPIFSLRSDDDFGVGDFYDLFKMVDWAAETGQKFLQILPINDTTMTHTWTDSYPYNANSTFALHPMFLRPSAVGTLKDKEKIDKYNAIATELNGLTEIDYEKVNDTKTEYLIDLYNELGKKTVRLSDYKKFVSLNEYWLKPYAAFCVLRDKYNTPDFNEWNEYKVYDENIINTFIKDNIEDIGFVYFLQYNLDRQLKEVRNYAHSRGVVLKGDIPIGISRTSVDAWVSPQLFYMDCQAGAPPDDFSVLGQNWGFPTYNWEEMNKDGFQWWKNRFKKMSEYFDAYRIDHILGFFRIWQIPMNAVHGLLGIFNPAMPYSIDELRSNYDFWLDVDLQTTPYIMDYFLHDFFGEYTEEVKGQFLTDKGYGRYGLKPIVDTQSKVVEYFKDKDTDDKNNRIKDALLGLIDNVLFIEDPEKKGLYHPRISAQFTPIYQSLTDYEKWCFDRLYNDFFYHRHNDFWYGKAMWKLPPLINATDMLVCGEDLGMIPDCVSAVMQSQQILSLEIQRMPKDPKQEFGNPYQYPYMSVCTTSTHDMPGIRAWWEGDGTTTQHFYNNMLHENGAAPYYAEPWVCDKIVNMHLNSPAMLTILPLQDWLAIDGKLRRVNPNEEQINVPANSRHYWRYRMHLTLDELNESKEFNIYLKNMIKNSGR